METTNSLMDRNNNLRAAQKSQYLKGSQVIDTSTREGRIAKAPYQIGLDRRNQGAQGQLQRRRTDHDLEDQYHYSYQLINHCHFLINSQNHKIFQNTFVNQSQRPNFSRDDDSSFIGKVASGVKNFFGRMLNRNSQLSMISNEQISQTSKIKDKMKRVENEYEVDQIPYFIIMLRMIFK